MTSDDERYRGVVVYLSLYRDEEASLQKCDGVRDPFMKLTTRVSVGSRSRD